MDDLDLPALPPLLTTSNTSQSSTNRPTYMSLSRKRTRSDYDDDTHDPTTSSDPALFSSDEQPPDAENYANIKRKKKMYRGSWWNHRQKVGKADRKREFRRNYDSGIFMGSESSDAAPSSDSFGSLEEELAMDQKRKEMGSGVIARAPAEPLATHGFEHTRKPVFEEQPGIRQARCIIQRCLDRGQEDVDLSSLSLSSLPAEVAELATFTKQTNIVPGMLDYGGTSLEPELRLFLSNNLLTYVPQSILSLHNLRVLSLRQNNLTSLPPSFRELVNLHTLNLAGNNLEQLPFEILELVALHNLDQIIAEPNPWLPLPDKVSIQSLTRPGTNSQMWRFASTEQTRPLTTATTGLPAASAKPPSRAVPPLTEVILRQLARLRPHSSLADFMPEDTSQSVIDALNLLTEEKGGCDRRCTRCARPIVSPAAQWTEWWTWSTKGDNARDGIFGGGPRRRRIIGVRSSAASNVVGGLAGNRIGTGVVGEGGGEDGGDLNNNNEWGWLPFVRMVCHERCDGKRNSWCREVGVQEE